jgi:hypothetical protein
MKKDALIVAPARDGTTRYSKRHAAALSIGANSWEEHTDQALTFRKRFSLVEAILSLL